MTSEQRVQERVLRVLGMCRSPNAECQALSKRSLSVCVARLQPPARAARRERGSGRVAHCETGARGAVDRVRSLRAGRTRPG